jgi:hypothetical protein
MAAGHSRDKDPRGGEEARQSSMMDAKSDAGNGCEKGKKRI